MIGFLVKRLVSAIPTLFGLSVVVFLMIRLVPGDPAVVMAGPLADPGTLDAIREDLGIDRPLPVQYIRFVENAVSGDFGRSFLSQQPTTDAILTRLPSTLVLVFGSLGVAVIVGIPLGILAARKPNSAVDVTATGFSALGISIPSFWLGLMLIFFFSIRLGMLPSVGMNTPASAILPIATYSLLPMALIARMTRTSMLEVNNQDYIQTARAMGISPWRITFHYALKNAMTPVATVIGIGLGIMLGVSVVVEVVFSIDGVGRLMVNSILSRDFPVVQATTLFMGVAFVVINIGLDILYGVLDPRVRGARV